MSRTKLEDRVRRLEPGDDRSEFRSGNIELDRFFQRYAGQNQFRHHIGTTYVAVQGDRITGLATVSSGEMVAERLSKKLRQRLPAYPLPILRLARLAVDERYQGHGIGRLLLRVVLELALEMRDRVGCIGVVVDAKPIAVTFYSSLGFQPIDLISGGLGDRPEPVAMFLPIGQIAAAVEFGSYENMKKMEQKQVFWLSGGRMVPKDRDNPNTYKVRRAKVGGYRDYFTDGGVAVIDRQLAESLDPMFDYQ